MGLACRLLVERRWGDVLCASVSAGGGRVPAGGAPGSAAGICAGPAL